jgi:hypothetical protein
MSGEVGRRPRCLLRAELSRRDSILSGRSLLAIGLVYGGRRLRLCCGLLQQRLHLLPIGREDDRFHNPGRGLLQQRLHLLPELLPLLALSLRQLGQRVSATDADFPVHLPSPCPFGVFFFYQADTAEIPVLLPVLHGPLHQRTELVRLLAQKFASRHQIGPQPVQRLLTQATAVLVVEGKPAGERKRRPSARRTQTGSRPPGPAARPRPRRPVAADTLCRGASTSSATNTAACGSLSLGEVMREILPKPPSGTLFGAFFSLQTLPG